MMPFYRSGFHPNRPNLAHQPAEIIFIYKDFQFHLFYVTLYNRVPNVIRQQNENASHHVLADFDSNDGSTPISGSLFF